MLHLVDGGDGASERSVRRQVERDGHRGELPLMVDRQRLSRTLKVRERSQRYGVAHRRTAAGIAG